MEKLPFSWDNALFASKAEINIFWNFFKWKVSKGDPDSGVKKKFNKTLILVFEVIVQPLKHTLGCWSPLKFFSKMLISDFEANSALFCKDGLFFCILAHYVSSARILESRWSGPKYIGRVASANLKRFTIFFNFFYFFDILLLFLSIC